jgi:hypothetical protein
MRSWIELVHQDEPIRRGRNGHEFIGNDQSGGAGYRHILFPPCPNSLLLNLEDEWEMIIPADYELFLKNSNGAVLYDNSIYLFGATVDLSRGEDWDDLAPISLFLEARNQRQLRPVEWRAGWRRIGAVVAVEKFSLLLNKFGNVKILSSSGSYHQWLGLNEMMDVLVSDISSLFSSNLMGDDLTNSIQDVLNFRSNDLRSN